MGSSSTKDKPNLSLSPINPTQIIGNVVPSSYKFKLEKNKIFKEI